jgi:hypothetical protein
MRRSFVITKRVTTKRWLMMIFAGAALSVLSLAQESTPATPPDATTNQQTPQQQQTPDQRQAPAQEQQNPQQQQAPEQQQTSNQQAQSGNATHVRVAPGSVIPVLLTKTVDAKKVKTGDQVEAKVTQDLKSVNGEILMPKDTKVVGHVTEAQARSKEQQESQLGIAFSQTVMKDGSTEALPMSIQAVIAPVNQNAGNASAGGGSPSEGGAMPSGNPGGHQPSMGGTGQQQAPNYPTGQDQSAQTPSNSNRPPVTSNTQGVIGLSNYSLSTPGDATQGSVVSSEKGNVKLESGTLILLRVNR